MHYNFCDFYVFTCVSFSQSFVEIPNVKPGTCYTQCYIADEYTTETEQIQIKVASSSVEIIAAQYESVSEQILVKDAATRIERVPAEYKTITKRGVKTPTQTRIIDIPAEYTTQTVRKLKTAATTRTETVPVIMGSYTTQIRSGCPAGYREDIGAQGSGDCIRTIPITAEYENRSFRRLVTPASVRMIPIPAEYTTVARQVLIKKGGFTEWRETDCIGKIINTTVSKLQQALIDRGYDLGPVNNIMGVKTKAAFVKYSRDNNFPTHSMPEVLKSLGVDY